MEVVRALVYSIFGALALGASLFFSGMLPDNLPEKGSFEAKVMCDKLFSENKIQGKHVKTWVSNAVIEQIESETRFWPELAKEKFYADEDVERTLDKIKAGVVSEGSINSINYLVEQYQPEKE